MNGQVSSLTSDISSTQAQIAAAKEAARKAAEEAARLAAQRQVATQGAAPASYETPNGGGIGQDYYADVNAARAAAATPINYNSPKEQLKQALLVRQANNSRRIEALNNSSSRAEIDEVNRETNAIIQERINAGIQ